MLGKTFSHYTIVEKLGEGGMGVVYLAEDTKLLRKVALKFLPEHTVDEAEKDRFLQEARAAAALNHPNVCTIHEIGEADGQVFISMEYVQGQTLKQMIDSGKLDHDSTVDLVIQIASGLKVAHDAGIVHRDIKPANIIVTPDGQAKILDFGLAKFTNLPGMTKSHTTLGTAAYMSPEQVQSSTVDHRSDIWSLGVCLYLMVSGQLPFTGENELALMYSISNLEPKGLGEVSKGTPAALSSTVSLMLAKKVDERYQSCEQLLADLNQSRPPRIPARKSRRGILIAGAFCLILLGFLGKAMWPESEPTTWQDDAAGMVAVLPFAYNGSPENEWLAEGLMDLLINTLDGIGGTHTVDASTVMLVSKQVSDSVTRIDGQEIASQLSVGRFILGEIIEVAGRLRISAGLYETANAENPPIRGSCEGEVDQLFELADQLAAKLFVGYQHDSDKAGAKAALASTSLPVVKLYLDGMRLYRGGDYRGAKAVFTRTVEQDSLFAMGWYALSWFDVGSLETINAARKAHELSDGLPQRERLLIAGTAAQLTGRLDEAEDHYQAILRTYPQDIWALESLCGLYWSYNPYRGRSMYEAIPYLHRIKDLDPDSGNDFYLAWYSIDMQDLDYLQENDFCGDGHVQMCIWNTLVQAYDSSSESIMDEYRETLNTIARENGVQEGPTTYPDTPYALLKFHGFHDTILKNFDWLRPSPTISLKLAHMLTDPSLIPLARQNGWWRQAYLSAARGRMQAAQVFLDSLLTLDKVLEAKAPQFIPVFEMYSRAQMLALPFLTMAPEARESMRVVLEQYDPSSVPDIPGWSENGNHEFIRLYLLGLLSCQLQDHPAALEYADQLYLLEPTEKTGSSTVDLALGIRARVARNEGRAQEALELMESAPRRNTYRNIVSSDFLEQSQERYFRGELLATLGQHDQALRWFDSTRNAASLLFNTIRFFKMAQCHDALGHREEAIENYQQFIRVWADCDPEQQHLVEDAQARLAQLNPPQ